MLKNQVNDINCNKCNLPLSIFEAEYNAKGDRIINGKLQCSGNHFWIIYMEVLRLDNPESDENVQFFDRPRTGFPNEVKEMERVDFIKAFSDLCNDIRFSNEKVALISGNLIFLMKYLENSDQTIILNHPDERLLRQVQEYAVRKRMYSNISLIRSDNVSLNSEHQLINIFKENEDIGSEDILIILSDEEKGKVYWSGENTKLQLVTL